MFGLRCRDAGGRQALDLLAHARGDGIVGFRLIELANGANCLVEELDLGREGIAEEARDAQGDIDARPAELGERDHLVAGHPPGRRVAYRFDAYEWQGY